MQRFATVFAVLVVSACGVDLIGRTQWSAVTGKLMCNGAPASGVQVKLMESDNSFLPGFLDTDDKMATGKADAAGEFSLSGSTAEVTDIEPYLAVFHDCSDGIKPCQRVYRVNIPSAYTNTGGAASKIYNAGVIELAGSHPDESRDCIH